jgi:hypothetical protein
VVTPWHKQNYNRWISTSSIQPKYTTYHLSIDRNPSRVQIFFGSLEPPKFLLYARKSGLQSNLAIWSNVFISLRTLCSHILISKSPHSPLFPDVPGGTQLHLTQKVPHALLHKLGLKWVLHLNLHNRRTKKSSTSSGWRYQTKLCVVKFLKQEYFVNGVCSTLRLMLVHYSKANYRQYPQHKKQA